ncbi:substance-P receptor-like isoform X2 [Anopheles albimanus]|uniref:substance-P receptor-like isoform X2 n=1 Tax=Anopheles albimanus TaxID=7167 RepID=UPI001640C448|nr:substance-P receptor-like isoform X2 [Anopheles albimanus]
MPETDIVAYHSGSNYTLNQTDVRIVLEDENLYKVPIGLLVLLSLFYGTISLLAVIGNSLVIWIVLTTKQMQTITNMFIANLALADVTIGVFAIPFQFQAALLQRWNLPEFMCPFCPFVQLISVNVSVFTLTAIAVDRHRAIINPLRARTSKNISKFVISAIWLLSFALAAPILFALRVRPVYNIVLGGMNETYTNVTVPFCKVVNFEHAEIQLYRYVLVLVQYFIPLFVISFVYIQMAFRLWGSKTPGNAQDSRDITMLKNKKKVIKMLIIVVALFGVCWFPLQLYNILHVTVPEINEYRFINIIWFVCDWLAMSNSCYNPFIYGIYNEKFKREFRKRYPFKRGQSFAHQHESDKTSSIFTRVSSIRSSYATSSIRNKLSTGRYSAPKQLPLAFKFPPATTHHYQHHGPGQLLHELVPGRPARRNESYPANGASSDSGGGGALQAATNFSHERTQTELAANHHCPVMGDLSSSTNTQRQQQPLRMTMASSTTDEEDEYRVRPYAQPLGEQATREQAPLRSNGSELKRRSGQRNHGPPFKHPHPDSGGESVDDEGSRDDRAKQPSAPSSSTDPGRAHLYCNSFEDLSSQ